MFSRDTRPKVPGQLQEPRDSNEPIIWKFPEGPKQGPVGNMLLSVPPPYLGPVGQDHLIPPQSWRNKLIPQTWLSGAKVQMGWKVGVAMETLEASHPGNKAWCGRGYSPPSQDPIMA